jgi:gliding motility-associated-like protein
VTDTVSVTIAKETSIFIPTAFTPNNDGLNDLFVFDILGATTVNVQIWNRWGERVYSNPAQANGMTTTQAWDGKEGGKDVQFDTYTYQFDVTYYDGHHQTITGLILRKPLSQKLRGFFMIHKRRIIPERIIGRVNILKGIREEKLPLWGCLYVTVLCIDNNNVFAQTYFRYCS